MLARRPAPPALASLELESGGAKGEQSDPLAIEFGDVAERLTGEAGAGKIMFGLERRIEGVALVVAEQADGDAW